MYFTHRHAEYISAFFTRPTMIASLQPADRRCRIHCPSRRTPTHLNASHSLTNSSDALPANPAQTTFLPAALAPRATKRGNAPSPAMSPSGFSNASSGTPTIITDRVRHVDPPAPTVMLPSA